MEPDGWATDNGSNAVPAAPAERHTAGAHLGTSGCRAGEAERQSEVALRQLRRPDGDGRGTRPRVLIIDDDDQLCETLREALRDDYAVASAPHGAAALDLVKVHEPALILLDLRMPIMDGWSFVQQYRRLAAAPAHIVVMSAAADAPNIATQLGVDGYLRKPFDLASLFTCVATHVNGGIAPDAIQQPPPRTDRPSSAPLN
ncbi:MAG TPA: response regulator [Candidatus Limnocylindria bacterium]